MALVAHFDLELHQMNFKIIFLNGDDVGGLYANSTNLNMNDQSNFNILDIKFLQA